MSARLTTMLAALVAILAIGVGCGGDDSGDGSAASVTGATGATGADSGPDGRSGGEGDGGGSDNKGVTTSSASKKAFIRQASQACIQQGRGLASKASAYLRKHGDEGLPEDVLTASMITEVMMPNVEEQIAAVREIGAPEGDEEKVEALLDAQQEAVDEVKQLDSVKSLEVVQKHFEKAGELYEEYGFRACTIG